MNVSLTPELREFLNNKVQSGRYSSASEGIRKALRLLEEQEQIRQAQLSAFRQAIDRRVTALDRDERVDPATVRTEIRRRSEARRKPARWAGTRWALRLPTITSTCESTLPATTESPPVGSSTCSTNTSTAWSNSPAWAIRVRTSSPITPAYCSGQQTPISSSARPIEIIAAPHGAKRKGGMVRGIEPSALFRDDADRADFVTQLAALARTGALTVYAWALLANDKGGRKRGRRF